MRSRPVRGIVARGLRRARRDARGTTAIEFGLVAALVALGIIGSLNLVGGNLAALYHAVADGFGGDAPTSGPPASAPNAIPAAH